MECDGVHWRGGDFGKVLGVSRKWKGLCEWDYAKFGELVGNLIEWGAKVVFFVFLIHASSNPISFGPERTRGPATVPMPWRE